MISVYSWSEQVCNVMASLIASSSSIWRNSQPLTLDQNLVIQWLWISMASSGFVHKNLKRSAPGFSWWWNDWLGLDFWCRLSCRLCWAFCYKFLVLQLPKVLLSSKRVHLVDIWGLRMLSNTRSSLAIPSIIFLNWYLHHDIV